MAQEKKVWKNGTFIPWEKATVHVTSHSVARGSAIFEVFATYGNTTVGTAAFRLPAHLDRLYRSASLLGMEIVQSRKEITQGVIDTVKANGVGSGYVKIVGVISEETYAITFTQPKLEMYIFAIPAEEYKKPGPPSISICLSRWRKLHPETVPIEAKVAANYLNGMMIRQEAFRRGYDMGISLDTQGFLAESSVEAVFMIKGGVVMAAPQGMVLSSISRLSIIDAAPSIGLNVLLKPIHKEEFLTADEIFISSTSRRVNPVHKIEDRNLGQVPGPVSKRLTTLMDSILAGREERFKDWLLPIR